MIDGIVLHNIVNELNTILVGGRIDKIAQPEKDELIIHIRAGGKKQLLLLSSQATMPRIHLCSENKKSPQNAPPFCMLLRKYIGNGRIMNIEQMGMERIVQITLEQLNELGDLCQYRLIIEIMGKHSNIILMDQNNNVLDSIKRIGAHISSVRQVYPGSEYQLPPNQNKINLLNLDTINTLKEVLIATNETLSKSIYSAFEGISPFYADHLCHVTGLDSQYLVCDLVPEQWENLYHSLSLLIRKLRENDYTPVLFLDSSQELVDYHCALLTEELTPYTLKPFDDMSSLIDFFFLTKSVQVRMKQKTYDLRRLLQNLLDRSYKKKDIQEKQLKDTENMETFKIKGELLLSNQYLIHTGDSSVTLLNYYTNEEETIVLDPHKSAIENANKAFEKYSKKKRTKLAVTEHLEKTISELNHLESVKYAVENVLLEEDIEDIRKELMETGYLRFKKSGKQKPSKSKPYHYLSSEGFHIYVGKNNLQNEELSMKFANNSDWWFHAKDVPGSHVIVKAEGKELPDSVYEEAAALAAYYSKSRQGTKVMVDYTQKKNLKKPSGSVPGYVIYHTNYSLFIEPNMNRLTQL